MPNLNVQFRPALFESQCNQFIKHLSPGNTRILFSGKFGVGKSYFLDRFFTPDTQEQKLGEVQYRAFHIYPVNYSIASNEDIFRYIKYDVIHAILLDKIKVEESDFKYIDALPDYIRNNLEKVITTLVYMLPKVGKSLYESYSKLDQLRKEFLKHAKGVTKDDGDKLLEFMNEVELKEGSIFENDTITQLICAILFRIKVDFRRENILVIDDLDRIDPAHVFRILNIFAAHLDNPDNLPNKLGFDRVILVCDINNLRSIFRATYGIHTDFNGYIDKFYSNDIFYLDNRRELREIGNNAFRHVIFEASGKDKSPDYEPSLFRSNSLPLELLDLFINYEFINLRSLLVILENRRSIDVERFLPFDELNLVPLYKVFLLAHFDLLKTLLGGYENIKEYASRIPSAGFNFDKFDLYCNQLLYFINYRQTLNNKGRASLQFNDEDYYMELPSRIGGGLDTLTSFRVENGLRAGVPQHAFSKDDFPKLLSEFLDIMIRIESKGQ